MRAHQWRRPLVLVLALTGGALASSALAPVPRLAHAGARASCAEHRPASEAIVEPPVIVRARVEGATRHKRGQSATTKLAVLAVLKGLAPPTITLRSCAEAHWKCLGFTGRRGDEVLLFLSPTGAEGVFTPRETCLRGQWRHTFRVGRAVDDALIAEITAATTAAAAALDDPPGGTAPSPVPPPAAPTSPEPPTSRRTP